MTTLTNEQIIEGMAKVLIQDVKFTATNQSDAVHVDIMNAMYLHMSAQRIKAVITYLSSIGYQITKIETDEPMQHAGWTIIRDYCVTMPFAELNEAFKAMSAVSRVRVEG